MEISNEIKVLFEKDSNKTKTRPVYQFNTGQQLVFENVEDGIEVQFANEDSKETINKVVENGKVQIPDILIRQSEYITAYIQIVTKNSETTKKVIMIPVVKRVEQADYVETDDEQTFRQFIEEKLEESKEIEKNILKKADNEIKKSVSDSKDAIRKYTDECIMEISEKAQILKDEIDGTISNALERSY